MRFVTFLKLVVAACVAFVIALVAVVKSIDVRQYRLLVIDLLHAATGRTVTIRGDFQIAWSLSPRVVATDVAVANPPGVAPADVLTIARFEAEIGLLALLRRDIEVQRLRLVEPRLALAVDESGQVNWGGAAPRPVELTPRSPAIPATSLRIRSVEVIGGRLVLRDRSARGLPELVLDQVEIGALDIDAPITLAAKGRFGRLPVGLSGSIGSFRDLADAAPTQIKLQAEAGTNRMLVDGQVGSPAGLAGLDLDVALEGDEVAEAARLLGRRVPALGPYRIGLRVTGSWAEPAIADLDLSVGRKEVLRLTAKGAIAQPWAGRGVEVSGVAESDAPARLAKLLETDLPLKARLRLSGQLADTAEGWQLSGLTGMVGRSDLAGTATLATLGPRPTLAAAVKSQLFDLEDFGVHSLPLPAKGKGGGPLFSDDTLLTLTDLAMDVELTWQAGKVTARGAVLCADPEPATLQLRGGVLMLTPFTMVQPQ
jgi:uncharacterized protein involved in outer membrane biogenesis